MNDKDVAIDYAFMDAGGKDSCAMGSEDVPDYMISGSRGDFSGVGDIHFFYSADEVLYGALPDFEAACQRGARSLSTAFARPGMVHCYCMLPYFKEAKEDFGEDHGNSGKVEVDGHGAKGDAIRGAYRLTGGNGFYDGMITCSTLPGKAVCRLVWGMDKAECDEYLTRALSGIPDDFSGRAAGGSRGHGSAHHAAVSDAAPGGDHLSGLFPGYDGAGAGESPERLEAEKRRLSSRATWARCPMKTSSFDVGSVAQRLSRLPGQGGRLSGNLPGAEARRNASAAAFM